MERRDERRHRHPTGLQRRPQGESRRLLGHDLRRGGRRARLVLHPDRGRPQGMGRVHLMAVRDMGRARGGSQGDMERARRIPRQPMGDDHRRRAIRMGRHRRLLHGPMADDQRRRHRRMDVDHHVPVRRVDRHQHDRHDDLHRDTRLASSTCSPSSARSSSHPCRRSRTGIDTVFGWILSFITQQMQQHEHRMEHRMERRSTTSCPRSSR